MTRLFLLLFTIFNGFIVLSLEAQVDYTFPVAYQGRFRPAEAYARFWLYERYHASQLKSEDLQAFHTQTPSPLFLLWSLETQGNLAYQEAPLFWIKYSKINQMLALPAKEKRLSYQQLIPLQQKDVALISHDKKIIEEQNHLRYFIQEFEQLKGRASIQDIAFHQRLLQLQTDHRSATEITKILDQEFPLSQRLKQAGPLFKAPPGRPQGKEWYALQALNMQVYDPLSQSLKPIGNFTIYSNEQFQKIQQAYFQLTDTFQQASSFDQILESQRQLSSILEQAYQDYAGKTYQAAHGKQLNYPSVGQLKIEAFYVKYPWTPFLIMLYFMTAILLVLTYQRPLSKGYYLAMTMMVLAIIGHTCLLLMRSYILARPPVSNMFETVMYVPWVAACVSLLFPIFRRNFFALLAACCSSIFLLLIIEMTDLNQNLDQVQAVLDSQFWLMIHVLLVVGSYGIYILGAILGHFYLGLFLIHRKETPVMKTLSQLILQTMYGGTILLVSGTILGGIWAAESWGRFWAWDPKESWAFISSCLYLIWIHAYRFHRIHSFGLAIGSIIGLLAISFTWYGVNYVLGTGLHSYGFGSGGEIYYYTFLISECLFVGLAIWTNFRTKNQKSQIAL